MKNNQSQSPFLNCYGRLSKEVLISLLVIVVFALGSYALLNLRNSVRENSKSAQAARLTAVANAALKAGATCGLGQGSNIDITSGESAVVSLNQGFVIKGMPYKMEPVVKTPSSYTVSGGAGQLVFGYVEGASYLP